MNKRRSGVIVSYIYSIAQVVVNLLYVPILLGSIGQSEYGLYQMVGSIIAYLSIINSTFSAGATRFYSKYYVLGDTEGMANTLGLLKRIYHAAYAIIIVVTFVLIGVISVVYRRSFSPWEIQESCMMLGVLAFNLMLTMNNTMSIACITAHEEFTFLKLSQLAILVVQPIAIVLLIQRWPYAFTVTLVQLVCNFALRMTQQVFARQRLGMDDQLSVFDRRLEHQIVRFSGTIVLATIADQIFWRSDQLILGFFYGTGQVAIYAVGSQIVNAYLPLGTAVASVFMPRVSELWHRERNVRGISDLFVRVSRISLYPLLAVFLGFIVFGQDFIRLWAGHGYQEAYWVAVIELMPFTIDVSQNIGLTILQIMNRYSFRAKMYFMAAVLNIVLTIWLAQAMGITGAAVASGVAMLFSSCIVLNWYYQRYVGLDMIGWWKSVLHETAPMVTLCIFAWFCWQPFTGCSLSVMAVGLVCWAMVFALVSYFLCANAYEKSLVRGVIRRISRVLMRVK